MTQETTEERETPEAIFRDIRCSMSVMNILPANREWITDRVRQMGAETQRATIAEMRQWVEAVGMDGTAQENAGLRWAKARMQHYLDEMESAIP